MRNDITAENYEEPTFYFLHKTRHCEECTRCGIRRKLVGTREEIPIGDDADIKGYWVLSKKNISNCNHSWKVLPCKTT